MMLANSDPVAALASVSNFFNAPTKDDCFSPSYSDLVAFYKNDSLSAPAADGARQWTYQTCAEFGYFQTSDDASGRQVFGSMVPLEFYTSQCTDVFGISATDVAANINGTNLHYGSTTNDASNVAWVNGVVDPWHALSVLQPNVPSSPTYLGPDMAHCAAMYPSRPDDPRDLVQARKFVTNEISAFLESA